MIFTFSFSAVIQENISDDAVDLADTTISELVQPSRIALYPKVSLCIR